MSRGLGHSHPPMLVTVNAFQAGLALSEQLIELDARGQPPVKSETQHSAAAEAPALVL